VAAADIRAGLTLDGVTLTFRKIDKGRLDEKDSYKSDLAGNSTRITRSGGMAESYTPTNYFYLFPLKVGAAFDAKCVQEIGKRSTDLAISLKVVGEEEVDTPLGKLRALRVERVSAYDVK